MPPTHVNEASVPLQLQASSSQTHPSDHAAVLLERHLSIEHRTSGSSSVHHAHKKLRVGAVPIQQGGSQPGPLRLTEEAEMSISLDQVQPSSRTVTVITATAQPLPVVEDRHPDGQPGSGSLHSQQSFQQPPGLLPSSKFQVSPLPDQAALQQTPAAGHSLGRMLVSWHAGV